MRYSQRMLTQVITELDTFTADLYARGDQDLRAWDTLKFLDAVRTAMTAEEVATMRHLKTRRTILTRFCTDAEVVGAIDAARGPKP